MADYVVDTSAVISYALEEASTPQARALISRMYQGDVLHIPEFCLLECANVIWKAARFQGLPQTRAIQIIEEFNRLPFRIQLVSSLLVEALQIGLAHQLAIYDSLYIALAKDLNLLLITLDERQSRAAIASGVPIKSINDFAP